MPPIWVRRIGSDAACVIVWLLLLPFAKVRVLRSAKPLPKGRMIMASNHISHFDPALITGHFGRQIDWMAMEELFKHPMAARVLLSVGAFPVHRGGADRAAIRTAIARLKDGAVVGIFPEGGIRAGETSILGGAEMRPGVAVLSAMAEAEVVPVVILGSERLYHRKNWRPFFRVPVWIAIGEPIPALGHHASSQARDEFCQTLRQAMLRLQDRVVTTFGLTTDDLPKAPQVRKGEDPYLPRER